MMDLKDYIDNRLVEEEYDYLILRLKNLEKEIEKIEKIYNEILKTFKNEFNRYANENNIDVTIIHKEKPKKEKKIDKVIEPPRGVKKIYREIAKKTHPDKNVSKTEERIKDMEVIYKDATKAIKENNWIKLLQIAVEFEIELPKPTKEQLNWIKNRVKHMEGEITEKYESVPWRWYREASIEGKKKILIQYVDFLTERKML